MPQEGGDRPLRLALAGAYCAGKGRAASLLAARGYLVLDADALGHRVLESRAAEVAARLGPACLDRAGRPDRAAIASIVFKDPRALQELEAIVHPGIDAGIRAWMAANADKPLALEAAVLHKFPAATDFDLIIELRAPFLLRLLRALVRDRRGLGHALARMRSQRGLSRALRRIGPPLVVLANPSSFRALERRLDRLLEHLEGSLEHLEGSLEHLEGSLERLEGSRASPGLGAAPKRSSSAEAAAKAPHPSP
jgi:dephospho-CoA kinase